MLFKLSLLAALVVARRKDEHKHLKARDAWNKLHTCEEQIDGIDECFTKVVVAEVITGASACIYACEENEDCMGIQTHTEYEFTQDDCRMVMRDGLVDATTCCEGPYTVWARSCWGQEFDVKDEDMLPGDCAEKDVHDSDEKDSKHPMCHFKCKETDMKCPCAMKNEAHPCHGIDKVGDYDFDKMLKYNDGKCYESVEKYCCNKRKKVIEDDCVHICHFKECPYDCDHTDALCPCMQVRKDHPCHGMDIYHDVRVFDKHEDDGKCLKSVLSYCCGNGKEDAACERMLNLCPVETESPTMTDPPTPLPTVEETDSPTLYPTTMEPSAAPTVTITMDPSPSPTAEAKECSELKDKAGCVAAGCSFKTKRGKGTCSEGDDKDAKKDKKKAKKEEKKRCKSFKTTEDCEGGGCKAKGGKKVKCVPK